MEAAPKTFSSTNLKNKLLMIKGVVYVKKLHVWSLADGKVFMTCHVGYLESYNEGSNLTKLLSRIKKVAKARGIKHTTIEVHLVSG